MDEIANQLKSLRLSSMANCWTSLLETHRVKELSLNDGLQLLLQAEYDGRKENRNARLIKEAHFRYQSSIEELVLDASRGFDKTLILHLATGEYIKKGIPVIITGATGTGKSWLATALGYRACLSGFKVKYYGIQKLFEQITLARIEATLPRFFDKMAGVDLLIIDDFAIKKLDGQQALDFMEIIEDRHARKATIIISQVPVTDWYSVLEINTSVADAVLDRILHTAQRFQLAGQSFRRK